MGEVNYVQAGFLLAVGQGDDGHAVTVGGTFTGVETPVDTADLGATGLRAVAGGLGGADAEAGQGGLLGASQLAVISVGQTVLAADVRNVSGAPGFTVVAAALVGDGDVHATSGAGAAVGVPVNTANRGVGGVAGAGSVGADATADDGGSNTASAAVIGVGLAVGPTDREVVITADAVGGLSVVGVTSARVLLGRLDDGASASVVVDASAEVGEFNAGVAVEVAVRLVGNLVITADSTEDVGARADAHHDAAV